MNCVRYAVKVIDPAPEWENTPLWVNRDGGGSLLGRQPPHTTRMP